MDGPFHFSEEIMIKLAKMKKKILINKNEKELLDYREPGEYVHLFWATERSAVTLSTTSDIRVTGWLADCHSNCALSCHEHSVGLI